MVWLPRQDQLQGMIDWESRGENGVYYQTDVLRDFVHSAAYKSDMPVNDRWPTWEQLWLAFVMKEKFNKVWWERTTGPGGQLMDWPQQTWIEEK